MMAQFFTMLNSNPLVVRTCCFVFAALILCWQLFFAESGHPHTEIEKSVPAFWTFFTIASCFVLVMAAKFYSAFVGREEDYYDK